MKNTTSPPIKYLTHGAFVKMLQYTLLAEVECSFPEKVAILNNNIAVHKQIYGFVPPSLYAEKKAYVAEWRQAWDNSRCICVDLLTGEISYPDKYKYLAERSIL